MKKLLFLMVAGFGVAMLIEAGHVTILPDHAHVAGYAVPLPADVQNSPVMGMVTTVLKGPPDAVPQQGGRPGARPVLPVVASTVSTYSANRPDQFNGAAKALRGSR
jgi:hypothetical protein